MAAVNAVYERGLPANTDAERLVLGSILLDDSAFIGVAAQLEADDFSLDKHKRIYHRMTEMSERGEKIDRITLANELMRSGELEAVDGLGYLVSLDEGLPQIYNLDSYTRIVKDRAVLRRIIFTSQSLIERCFLGQEEPDTILADAEDKLLKLGEARVKDTLENPGQIIEKYENIEAFLDPTKRPKGIQTGFVKLDEMTSGMHAGELIIVAARPAMGKTAFAMNIAQYVATNPHGPQTVAVFSLEMSKESLLTRMICSGARVDQSKFRAGFLNNDERRRLTVTLHQLVEAPLFIDDTPGVTLMDVHAKLRRLRAEHGLGLVVIDYLQLMQGRGRQENRQQEVSAISRGLKLLAKELRVPFVVLSQLSRAPDTRPGDHRPQVSDLRESGSIEQDADVVGFIYREEVYKPDREDLKGLAKFIIGKQRNGPIGDVNLVFLREFTKFENRTNDMDGDSNE